MTVAAVVTAGVQTNATCAGDPAEWRETLQWRREGGSGGRHHQHDPAGQQAAYAGGARSHRRNDDGSKERRAAATGGAELLFIRTSQRGRARISSASRHQPRATPLTSASPHMKFGEIVGLAVRDATVEALRWQNGLEPSYTRGIFHALGRYGLKEQTIFDELGTGCRAQGDLELLRKKRQRQSSTNRWSEPPLMRRPLCSIACDTAHCLESSRARCGECSRPLRSRPVCRHNRIDGWSFARELHASGESDPKTLVLDALALGWSEKWRPR